ncbi:hypothetical protein EVC62_05325 [Salinicola endophyticus]|uniref:Lipoprotein n=1 Tax=Salinicola endophyticus TaxID=1949083 RepID=A0ABY8FFY4_9GAMM|nr:MULTISPECIES: lipoprotein [Salinicola]WFF40965.1 hypothetical protein EVC62_05325 [Salinicola endophyticus]
MSRNLLLVALLALTGLAVAGCGQKGPLYLPEDNQAAKTYDPQGTHDDAQQGEPARQGDTAQAQPQHPSQTPQAEAQP